MKYSKIDPLKIIAILNTIFALIVFLDVSLPGIYEDSQKYDRILISNENRKTGYSRSYEIKNLLVCESGEVYRLGRVPKDLLTIKQGQKIKIKRSRIFSKVDKIEIQAGKKWTHFYVSFFSNILVILLFIISLIYCISYIFKNISGSEVCLPLSSALIFFLSGAYLIFF